MLIHFPVSILIASRGVLFACPRDVIHPTKSHARHKYPSAKDHKLLKL